MKSKAPDLFRVIVTPQPDAFFLATQPIEAHIGVPSIKTDGSDNPLVFAYVAPNLDPNDVLTGVPLLFDTYNPLWLNPGDKLYLMSIGESQISCSVKPWKDAP